MPADQKTSLVMDTFVIMDKEEPVYVVWDELTLNSEEIDLLNGVLANVHYLGRAESWCSMSMTLDCPPSCNCVPLGDETVSSEQEVVRVLTPNNRVQFEDLNNPTTRSNNLESITVTTKALQDKNYADPPGARWQLYSRPLNCLEGKRDVGGQRNLTDDVTLVRYAVIGNIRPDVRDTLRIGDMTRTACMSRYGRANDGETSTTFSGKDSQGKPLVDHTHAFFLPTCETQNREIDHVTIVAKNGFERKELNALLRLKRLYRYNTNHVNLLFQGCGSLHEFSSIRMLGTGRTWVSATPLILTRHIKYKGQGVKKRVVDGLEEQIRREISKRYGSAYDLERVTVFDEQKNIYNTIFKPAEFFRWRNHGSKGWDRAYNVKLQFQKPISGPLLVGYATHFGLGMFVPEEEGGKTST